MTSRVRDREVGEVRRRLLIAGVVVLLLAALAPSARAGTPGTMTITSDTTLTEDHFGSIEIAADDITLDCAGFSVIGPSPDPWPVDGVLVDQHSGVTIKNCTASGFVNGFKLQGGDRLDPRRQHGHRERGERLLRRRRV